jgi:hypothetical protein
MLLAQTVHRFTFNISYVGTFSNGFEIFSTIRNRNILDLLCFLFTPESAAFVTAITITAAETDAAEFCN